MNLDLNDLDLHHIDKAKRPVLPMKYQALLQAFLAVIAGLFAITLYDTCMEQPWFPFQPENGEWTKKWLFTTVGDFYVLSTCLSVIILCTEPCAVGVVWVLLINCLGSPFACIYLIVRLTQNRNLSLRDKREYQIISKNEG